MTTKAANKKLLNSTAGAGKGPRICPHCGHVLPNLLAHAPRGVAELTGRQTAVLRMIAMGYTAKQIGEELQISQRTAEFHRNVIMDKTGLRSSAELTVYALANHLVSL